MTYTPNPKWPTYWMYDGLPIQADVETHQLTVEIAKRLLPKDAMVLDVASGHGALSKALVDNGFKVSCTSWNGKMNLPIPTFMIDLDKSFDPASVGGELYDLACAVEIIEHVENPAQLIRSAAASVQPGGYLIVSTPNVESAQARFEWLLNGYPYSFSNNELYENRHIALLWRQGIEAMVTMAGFDIVERHFPGTYRFSSFFSKLIRLPIYWMISTFGRGDSRGPCRLIVAKRSNRAPRVLGADDVV